MVRSHNSAGPEELKGRGDAGDKGTRKVRAKGKLAPGRFVVTPTLRRKLKKRVGTLYRAEQLHEREFLDCLLSSPRVISVVDRVTESLHALGRTPDVQVVDEVERRVKRAAPDVPFVRLLRAANPAGTITLGAIQAVTSALEGVKPARVLIDGEEDLLAIPAIEAAPVGSSLYYGQPGEGVVMVLIDEGGKAPVKRTYARMKRE